MKNSLLFTVQLDGESNVLKLEQMNLESEAGIRTDGKQNNTRNTQKSRNFIYFAFAEHKIGTKNKIRSD